jgi:hypothetical protein
MPALPKPTVTYAYDVAAERKRLRAHKSFPNVLEKAAGAFRLGSWNVAAFGAPSRPGER